MTMRRGRDTPQDIRRSQLSAEILHPPYSSRLLLFYSKPFGYLSTTDSQIFGFVTEASQGP